MPVAIQKAMDVARRNMKTVKPQQRHAAVPAGRAPWRAKVHMQPASEGTGIIAGGAMRAIFEALGVRDVLAKIIGTNNPINVVRATINGLSTWTTRRQWQPSAARPSKRSWGNSRHGRQEDNESHAGQEQRAWALEKPPACVRVSVCASMHQTVEVRIPRRTAA